MKKLIASAVLILLPLMFCFAANPDKPTRSVTSRIRVIIPPFAVIHLGNNIFKAVPLSEVAKEGTSGLQGVDETQSAVVESNKTILTISESKTEKTSSSIEVTTTHTSTEL